MLRSRVLIFLSALFAFAVSAHCAELKYSFAPGASYQYVYSWQEASSVSAMNRSFKKDSLKYSASFSLNGIDCRDNGFILDLITEKGTFRRYISENGALTAAPGEIGQLSPFLITFPEQDWKVGEKIRLPGELSFGKQKMPAAWNLMLKSENEETGEAEILFALSLKLPEDRLRTKELTVKGRIIFNTRQKMLQKAEWNSAYTFSLVNKEFAITRNLWKYERKSTHQLMLKEVKK